MVEVLRIAPEETYAIRKTELRKNMSLSHKMKGDMDVDSLHLGVFEDGDLACIGSFINASHDMFSGKQYQLRGMATKEIFKGKGYGKILMENAESILKKDTVDILWCNARVSATGFYDKLGYESVGAEFSVPEIGPHLVMYKKL